ncbi:MAG: ABC transporter ATP-binding protein [Planctomycetes bacterium]|nr:ABC transporter ATP-binding protein [Planctomycetota bacterium]
MAFVELKNIEAGYVKGSPVLKSFSLSVEKGELLSLLGPSGCGKTTTLRTIAGFIMAEKGSVKIGGRDYTRIPPNKRNIGLVFQSYALFPHLSVFNNVAYGLRRRKVDRATIRRKVADVLKLVSLEHFEERLPSQLSGGQMQRVALARSIVIEPDLLLLDEPLSNLDAKLRVEMRAELSRLQRRLGITMIYVTHDQIEALSLSSRIIVINEGTIEQIGTPEVIYQKPATPFVARFMGFDNRLSGTVIRIQDDRVLVNVQGFEIKAILEKIAGLKRGHQVELFFRPDDAALVNEKRENILPVKVNYYNFQGNSIQYSVNCGESELNVVMVGKHDPQKSYEFLCVPADKLIVETRGGG